MVSNVGMDVNCSRSLCKDSFANSFKPRGCHCIFDVLLVSNQYMQNQYT